MSPGQFQSSPHPKTGRDNVAHLLPLASIAFQSSPHPKTGRDCRGMHAIGGPARSFNPRPIRRQGATRCSWTSGGRTTAFQSSPHPKTGRDGKPLACWCRHDGVSILAPSEDRARLLGCIQPTGLLRVSILAPSEDRARLVFDDQLDRPAGVSILAPSEDRARQSPTSRGSHR